MNNMNPVDWAVLALTAIVSRSAADVLGPIAVTVVFAFVGAGWSLSRREEPLTGTGMTLYVGRIVGLALAVTALAAQVLSTYLAIPAAWFVGPLALLIGAIGDDWIAIGRWSLLRIAALVQRKTGD